MGLTVNLSSTIIASELAFLKAELEEKLKIIDKQLLLLEEVVFYSDSLEAQPRTWESVRLKRDLLLKNSDWTMVTGATVNQREWSRYRQVLRDIPQTYKGLDPLEIQWPEEPSIAGPNTTPVE